MAFDRSFVVVKSYLNYCFESFCKLDTVFIDSLCKMASNLLLTDRYSQLLRVL